MTSAADTFRDDERQPAGWRGVWTAPRARLWLVAGAIAAYLPLLGVPLRSWLDFSSFYAAGTLAFTPDVARLAPIVQYQVQHGLPPTPFVYPAGVALLYVPFTWLPYGVAAALHVALMAALLVVAAAWGATSLAFPRKWAILGALAWGPAAAGVISGQNTSVALLLVVAAGGGHAPNRERRRPASPPGCSPTSRSWARHSPVSCCSFAAAGGSQSSWSCFGVSTPRASSRRAATWPGRATGWTRSPSTPPPTFHDNGWQAISLPGPRHPFELVLGLPGLALLGYAGRAAIAIVVASRPCAGSQRLESIALACALGLVVSPHAWVYDATLLLPAVGVFAATPRAGAGRGRTAGCWPSPTRSA